MDYMLCTMSHTGDFGSSQNKAYLWTYEYQRDWDEDGVRQQLKVTQLLNVCASIWAPKPSSLWSTSGSTHVEAAGTYVANSVTWVLPLESETLKSVAGKAPRGLAQMLQRLSLKATMSHLAPCARNIFVQRNTRGHGYSPEWHMEQIYQRPTKKSPKHTESLIFILGVPYSLLFPKDYFPNLGIRLTRLRPDLLLMAKAYTSLPLMCIHWFKHHNIMKLCLCFIYGDKWGNQG